LSLKENIQALQTELSSEEKFFESAVKTERFVKKYQKPLIASLLTLVFGLGGYAGYEAYEKAKMEKANSALNLLLMNPSDSKAKQELANNSQPLYELYTLSQALKNNDLKVLSTLKSSKSGEVADIATYESAIISKNEKELGTYSKKQDAIYGDLATIELAVKDIQAGNASNAHTSLSRIKEDSSLYPLAQMLSHYGVK
jgi:predicted negative regulator of RcsB-dependent stress response